MPEEKTKFSSFWGDMEVSSESIAPAKEEKDDITKEKSTKEPAAKTTSTADTGADHEGDTAGEDDKGAGAQGKDDKEEVDDTGYEYTEDDVSKAYGILEEEGILELGEDDEFEATTTGLADAVAATVRHKLEKEIAAIPPVVQEFYAHVTKGGNASSFTPSSATIGWADADLEVESNQDAALKTLYLNQGMTEEEAVDALADIPEEKKAHRAEIARNTLARQEESQKAAKTQAQKAAEKAEEDKAKQEVEDIKKNIRGMKSLAGFELDDDRKQEFEDYLFKVNPRTGKTQMQENMAQADRRLTIAMLDFVNYTKADLEKEVATKLTKNRKKKLSRYTDKGVKNLKANMTVKEGVDSKKGKLVFPSIFTPADED